jgi:hypothetical protein
MNRRPKVTKSASPLSMMASALSGSKPPAARMIPLKVFRSSAATRCVFYSFNSLGARLDDLQTRKPVLIQVFGDIFKCDDGIAAVRHRTKFRAM